MMPLSARITALLILTGLYSGCSLFTPKGKTPLATEPYPAAANSKTLMVMMPGIGNSASDFASNGFINDLQTDYPHIDVITAETHFGYFKERTLTTRLKQDIITPAQRQGYNEIWLMGTSLGGLGSLLYAAEYPNDIAGIITIAPYLGEKALIRDITSAPSLSLWAQNYQGNDELARAVWIPLIQKHCMNQHPKIILATGDDDKFIKAHQLLAKCLPESQVHVIEGKHNWNTWEKLWLQILENEPFAEAASK